MKTFFDSILTLDSYNRVYGEGIDVPGQQLGFYSLELFSENQGISFFAQSYTRDSETIISFRGTDNFWFDLFTGYSLAIGSPGSAQANAAAEFYKTVNGDSSGANRNIILTGHSLGGGLAGYVGGIFGVNSLLFDNMPFESGVHALLTDSLYAGLRQAYFNSPAARPAPDYPIPGTGGYYVGGEFLWAFRHFQDTSLTKLESENSVFDLNPVTQLHSQSLLAILLYAEKQNVGSVEAH